MQLRINEENKDFFGKLWYQRLKFDNRFVTVFFIGHVITILLSYQIIFFASHTYILSINALIESVCLIMSVLFIFYPSRLMNKLSETFENLIREDIITGKATEEALSKIYVNIYRKYEKYIPVIIAIITVTVLLYDNYERGFLLILDYTDIYGNHFVETGFPLAPIAQILFYARTFIQIILAFSTMIVALGISRSMNYVAKELEIRIISPGSVGGLLPIGRLMTELTVVIMGLPSILAFLGALLYMISGIFSRGILFVVTLGYVFLCVTIPPPLLAIRAVMTKRKMEALNHISSEVERLRKNADQGHDDEVRRELKALRLMSMLKEVRRMRTIPFDYPMMRRITMMIITPLLSCISVVLQE